MLNKEKLLEWLQEQADKSYEHFKGAVEKGRKDSEGLLIGDDRISAAAFHNREIAFEDIISWVLSGEFDIKE